VHAPGAGLEEGADIDELRVVDALSQLLTFDNGVLELSQPNAVGAEDLVRRSRELLAQKGGASLIS